MSQTRRSIPREPSEHTFHRVHETCSSTHSPDTPLGLVVMSEPSPRAISEPAVPCAPTRSPGREVYECLEIRQQILGLLDKHSLTQFMRIEKKCMFSVAQELYYSMSYTWVRSHMAMTTRTYCAAVREIDARKMKLAPAALRQTSFVLEDPKRRTALTAKFLSEYHIDVFHLVVPPMRRKCPNLRRSIFGGEIDVYTQQRREDTWVVHCDPPPAVPLPKSKSLPQTGYIDYIGDRIGHLSSDPATAIIPPPPPSEHYEMRMRFNFSIASFGAEHPLRIDEWLLALQEQPIFGHLYKTVDFGELPISLDVISKIYARQNSHGSSEGLAEISAPRIAPWDIADLGRFASVVSTTLTSLSLTDESWGRHTKSRCDFTDLPGLISIIRNDLPKLKELRVTMTGIEDGESVCRSMLDESTLSERGTLEHLRIVSRPGHCVGAPFNILRVLSSLCATAVDIELSGTDHAEGIEVSEWICELREQCTLRRAHLSHVDFASLGVTELHQVLQLEYHDDGRPRGLWESRAVHLYERIQPREGRAHAVVPTRKEQASLDDCLRSCRQIMELPARSEPRELLKELRAFRTTVGKVHGFENGTTLHHVANSISYHEYELEASLRRH